MKLIFAEQAWDDYLHWQKTDKQKLKRINALIKDNTWSPFEGIGQPVPLQHAVSGYWSRRIDSKHRIVYKVRGDSLLIAQARYHY